MNVNKLCLWKQLEEQFDPPSVHRTFQQQPFVAGSDGKFFQKVGKRVAPPTPIFACSCFKRDKVPELWLLLHENQRHVVRRAAGQYVDRKLIFLRDLERELHVVHWPLAIDHPSKEMVVLFKC